VRTTVDLPDDVYAAMQRLAGQADLVTSDVITELIRLGLRHSRGELLGGRRGLPVVSVGRPVTAEDVRLADD
jgi:predicted transcriptional regulator